MLSTFFEDNAINTNALKSVAQRQLAFKVYLHDFNNFTSNEDKGGSPLSGHPKHYLLSS